MTSRGRQSGDRTGEIARLQTMIATEVSGSTGTASWLSGLCRTLARELPASGAAISLMTVDGNAQLGKVIIGVDPGHGGFSPSCKTVDPAYNYGASSSDKPIIYEKDVNLSTALTAQKYLTQDGATVVITRTDDSCVSLKDRVNRLQPRACIYNATNAANRPRLDMIPWRAIL